MNFKSNKKDKFTSGQLAKLANVTLRTIRYYDKEGLLKPSFVADNGFRYYNDNDLIKLQQIMLFKYLGFSLSEIKSMEQESDFVPLKDPRGF